MDKEDAYRREIYMSKIIDKNLPLRKKIIPLLQLFANLWAAKHGEFILGIARF